MECVLNDLIIFFISPTIRSEISIPFVPLSASASVIIYDCELPARLVLITVITCTYVNYQLPYV